MRITQGSGSKRNSTSIVGAVRNAQGHIVKQHVGERQTVGSILRRMLFPDNAGYHQAKRRGEKAIAGLAAA